MGIVFDRKASLAQDRDDTGGCSKRIGLVLLNKRLNSVLALLGARHTVPQAGTTLEGGISASMLCFGRLDGLGGIQRGVSLIIRVLVLILILFGGPFFWIQGSELVVIEESTFSVGL